MTPPLPMPSPIGGNANPLSGVFAPQVPSVAVTPAPAPAIIVPTYEALLLVSPFAVIQYPQHFLCPDSATASALAARYGGTPIRVLDPELEFKQGLWQIVPNSSYWLMMPGGIGVECSELALYWHNYQPVMPTGPVDPGVVDKYCHDYIAECVKIGQQLPPKA